MPVAIQGRPPLHFLGVDFPFFPTILLKTCRLGVGRFSGKNRIPGLALDELAAWMGLEVRAVDLAQTCLANPTKADLLTDLSSFWFSGFVNRPFSLLVFPIWSIFRRGAPSTARSQ